jgi:hypothetical protein
LITYVCSCTAAESAAALAKARKKLLKIQGIASQANKAHSSIVVDVDVLAGEAAADEEQAAADCRGQASNSSSRDAAGRSSEAVGTHEQRSSKQGAAAGSSASTGALRFAVSRHALSHHPVALALCFSKQSVQCMSPHAVFLLSSMGQGCGTSMQK